MIYFLLIVVERFSRARRQPEARLIFKVCQPQQAKKVLDENLSVCTALPCRISLYEEGAKTFLATLKPTTLLALFNTPQLKGVAQEVENTIVKIMNEEASGKASAQQ